MRHCDCGRELRGVVGQVDVREPDGQRAGPLVPDGAHHGVLLHHGRQQGLHQGGPPGGTAHSLLPSSRFSSAHLSPGRCWRGPRSQVGGGGVTIPDTYAACEPVWPSCKAC